jgi:hypothetical protein
MSRYETEHNLVDVSPIPLIPMLANETVITDTQTGETGRGFDWNGYAESDRQAWDDLKSARFTSTTAQPWTISLWALRQGSRRFIMGEVSIRHLSAKRV